MRHEELAEAILLSPALQRLHAVFRQDRLPVVPSQAVAQRERVLHAVGRHGGPIDHLRFDLKVLVCAEERVVHKIAVVARDVGGRPDRIEDLQIGLRHEAQGLPIVLGVDRRRAQRHGGGRARASDGLSATDAVHLRVPPYRANPGACSLATSIEPAAECPAVIGTDLNCLARPPCCPPWTGPLRLGGLGLAYRHARAPTCINGAPSVR